jgi:hypothetical protein
MSTSDINLISIQKYRWWCQPMVVGPLTNPKIAVLLNLMGWTPRLTDPTESLFNGYCRLDKFHDKEPGLLLSTLLKIDPEFFANYPTREGQALNHAGMKAAIGEAASAFLKRGVPGWTKGEGKQPAPQLSYIDTLAAAIEQAKVEVQEEQEQEPHENEQGGPESPGPASDADFEEP